MKIWGADIYHTQPSRSIVYNWGVSIQAHSRCWYASSFATEALKAHQKCWYLQFANLRRYRSVARIFRGVGGGVRTSKNGTKYLVLDWYAMQVSKRTGKCVPAYGVPEIGTIFNGTGRGNLCERRRSELLEWEVWGHAGSTILLRVVGLRILVSRNPPSLHTNTTEISWPQLTAIPSQDFQHIYCELHSGC